MWALSGLWQNPNLLDEADGTVFMSHGVAFPIFTAMRDLHEQGKPVDLVEVFKASGLDMDVALGLWALPEVKLSEDKTRTYLAALSRRFESEEEAQYAA